MSMWLVSTHHAVRCPRAAPSATTAWLPHGVLSDEVLGRRAKGSGATLLAFVATSPEVWSEEGREATVKTKMPSSPSGTKAPYGTDMLGVGAGRHIACDPSSHTFLRE